MKSGFVGMFGASCLILCAIVLGGGNAFFNVPSLVICIFLPIGLSMASAGTSDLGHALRALRCLLLSRLECDLTVRNSQVLRHMISYAYAAGVIGALIGWIQMLRELKDISGLALGFSLTTLTIFYSILISECILRPAARQIEGELENKNG